MNTKKILTVFAVFAFIFLLGKTLVGTFPSKLGDFQSQLAQVSSGGSNYCLGYGDDRDYNYDLTTNIFTKTDGTESFTLARKSDGKVVRQDFSDEAFFVDKSSGALNISYDIVAKCGGVDVVYTVSNPTGQSQNAPDLRVEGITQHTSGDFYLLDTRDTGYIRNIKKNDGTISNIFLGSAGRENTENWNALTYPTFYYSPVIVAEDTDFTVGSALLYPYLSYKHEIVPQMTKVTTGLQTGTWRHEYKEFSPAQYAKLSSGEQRTYTITLRFTNTRNWITTIEPYKTYFRQTYGSLDQVRPIDRRPVYGMDPTSELVFNPTTNPRSYRADGIFPTLLTTGWNPVLYNFIQEMVTYGFERSMIWAPSGLYSQDIICDAPHMPGFNGQACNYPTAFMDFLPILSSTASLFDQFSQSNIDLGFWWGNAAHVPTPQVWDPPVVVDADYSNPTHVSYLNNQLTIAHNRGAKIIGLDGYSGNVFDRYYRIDAMKQLTNNDILFLHEGSGPDILHRKIANVVFNPMQYSWWTQFDKTTIAGPDVLSHYINEGAEIWFMQHRQPLCGASVVEELASYGFTPVYVGICEGQYPVNVRDLNLTLATCFDGSDNDRDGLVDWPRDPGCDSPMDDNERNSSGIDLSGFTQLDEGGGGTGNTPTPSRNTTTSGSYSRSSLLRQIQELERILASLIAQLSAQRSAPVVTPTIPATTRPSAPIVSRPPTTPVVAPAIPPSLKWGATPNSFSMNLSLGSTGAEVTLLQQFLVNRGLLVMTSASSFGTYGPMTRDAVARLQSFMGLPVTGDFDSATRARVNQF